MDCLLTMCVQELRRRSLDFQPRHWFMWNELHDPETPRSIHTYSLSLSIHISNRVRFSHVGNLGPVLSSV